MQATFTGQEYDEETDIQYFINRYYDNELGRFTSIDPLMIDIVNAGAYNKDMVGVLANPQELNSYSYVANNPVIYVDPFGLSGEITIYSNGGGGNSSENMISGHSWITYTSDDTNKTTSYGVWGNNPYGMGNGLLENVELTKGMTTSDASRTSHIDDKQETAMFATIQDYKDKGASGWMLMAPCSAFAQDAWNDATGEYLNANTSIVNNPQTLKNSIINANGGNGYGTLSPAVNDSFWSTLYNSANRLSNSVDRIQGNTYRGVGKAINPIAQRLYNFINK